NAYRAYYKWHEELIKAGAEAIATAKKEGLQMVVLAGRPYHIDPEINHGIDKLISSFNIVILTEDAVADLVTPQSVNVLNQWTYHARLYNAAKYCTENSDTELIQLVSFGCGIDAITTDEVRDILEKSGKLYTAFKIDEINNLGSVKIRIRSLLGAIEERKISAKGVNV
ncbi:MAG: acyl-CoA dehydratase activase-related protein, partial [Oscillospiraceae bacterium]